MSENLFGPIPRMEAHSCVRSFKAKKGRYRLTGSKCKNCGAIWYPERYVCPKCHGDELIDYECARSGMIVTFWIDTMGFPPIGYEDIDNRVIAIIRLDDGIHVISEIVDTPAEEIHRGDRVRMTVRLQKREDTGNLFYGYKFEIE
jgi:uncharacterized OB-fold protein